MKICVIEDEQLVKEGIIQKLSQIAGSGEIFDANYGMKAVEQLLMIKPNLVFLDISMPEISGLDILHRVKGRLPDTRFVILTGYGEFQYARKALQLGAKNYLLKPVYTKDLQTVINDIHLEFSRDAEAEMLQDIRLLEQAGYALAEVEIARPDEWFDAGKPKRVVFGQAETERHLHQAIIQFTVEGYGPGAVIGMEQYDVSGICFLERMEWTGQLLKAIELDAACHFFGEPKSESAKRVKRPELASDSSVRRLRGALISAVNESPADPGTVETRLKEWSDQAGAHPLERLKQECVKLLLELEGTLPDRDKYVDEDDRQYWEDWVEKFREWGALKQQIAELIHRRIFEMQGSAKMSNETIILHIRDLVENAPNYSELTLHSVAEQFRLHPVTLSRLFKKQVGTNFIHYLTRQKMNRAKNLLIGTPKKINEIAEDLGYSNYRYFSLLFKKTFDVTPQELRRDARMTVSS